MPEVYISERQVEHWLSREIERFFLDSGYDLLSYPLSPTIEHDVPSDFAFFENETEKLFGLQYKTLYRNKDDFWRLDKTQHDQLQNFSWMAYGLSDIKRIDQNRNALHYLRILKSAFTFRRRLTRKNLSNNGIPRYTRWGAFFERIRSCAFGLRIRDKSHLLRTLWPDDNARPHREIRQFVDEIYFLNLDRRRGLRLSNQLQPE